MERLPHERMPHSFVRTRLAAIALTLGVLIVVGGAAWYGSRVTTRSDAVLPPAGETAREPTTEGWTPSASGEARAPVGSPGSGGAGPAPSERQPGGFVLVDCVRADTGAPIPGAELFLMPEGEELRAAIEIAQASGQGFDDLARSIGQRLVSDENGQCRVPTDSTADLKIWAFAPGWSGYLTSSQRPKGTNHPRVELHPTHVVEALVLDAQDGPLPGIRVDLDFGSPVRLSSLSDARGHVRIELPGDEIEGFPDRKLGISGLFEPDVAVTLSAGPPASDPLVLRVPPFGYIDVELEQSDIVALPLTVALRASDDDPRSDALRYLVDDTRARLGPIGLGLRVEVEGTGPGTRFHWRGVADGPRHSGEVVRMVLAPPPVLWIRGRALQPNATPLRSGEVHAVWEDDPRKRDADYYGFLDAVLQTDADGRFAWSLPEETFSGGPVTFTARLGKWQATASLEIAASGPGELDIGDVQLELPPLIVSGTVMDTNRRPLEGVVIHVSKEITASTTLDGTFELRGALPEGPQELNALRQGWLRLERPFTVGMQGLELVLEEGATLTGVVHFDERLDPRGLRVQSSPWVPGRPNPELDSSGRFEHGPLPQGEYDLMLSGAMWLGPPWPLAEKLLLGNGRQALTFDLRARLCITRVRISDVEGHVLDEVWYEVEAEGTPERGSLSLQAQRSAARNGEHSWVSLEPTTVRISALGSRSARLHLDGTDRYLRLPAGAGIDVVLAGAERIPHGIALGLRLSPFGKRELLVAGRAVHGKVRLELGAGGVWVGRLTLHDDEEGHGRLGQTVRLELEDTAGFQPITIELEQRTLERAEQMARD